MEEYSDNLWDKAVSYLRSTLKNEADISQMERYFSMILSHHLSGNKMIAEVNDEIQQEWFGNLYSVPLSNAIKLVGGPSDAVVSFVVKKTNHQKKENPVVPPVQIKKQVQSDPPKSRTHRKVQLISTIALDPQYTFESYVRGPSNSFAVAAASAVAKNPGLNELYNPLFIYGQTGLGKTHLMQAIGNKIVSNLPGTNVCYITAETFLNEYVNALQDQKINDFRARYRQFDVLLIDDVQFIAGKDKIQEEFFNTFNSLMVNKKQVVMTSDVKPQDLSGLETRLMSRFSGGMVCEIESPSLETRLAILKTKSEHTGITIPSEILYFIAENIKSHVRALEGALRRVIAFINIQSDTPLTLGIVKMILKDYIETEKVMKDLTVEEIQKATAEYYGISVSDILSMERTQSLVTPRQVSMFISRKLTTKSLPDIAKAFSKTHATVHHGTKAIQDRLNNEDQLRAQIIEIVTKLGRNTNDLFD